MKVDRANAKLITKAEAFEILVSAGHRPSVFLENVLAYCTTSIDREEALKIKKTLMDMGMTEFEAIQAIDCSPRSLLCLQLIVEDMEERFSENDLMKILDLFKHKK